MIAQSESTPEYSAYLRSDSWRDLRRKVAERSRGLCELCGSSGHHVHHIRYPKNLADDRLANLLMVCETCHKKLHGIADPQVVVADKGGPPDWFFGLDAEGRAAEAALWHKSAALVFGAEYLKKIEIPGWVRFSGSEGVWS